LGVNTNGVKMKVLAFVVAALISTPIHAGTDESLASAAYMYLAKKGDVSYPGLRTFTADLNDDGREDGVVLLTGNRWCGSGGCSMLVFEGAEHGFRLVSTSTIANEPVAVLPTTEHGWHTLIVSARGKGSVMMPFDGRKYPSNPSTQRKASGAEVEHAHELLMKLAP
jgi:hypothetical protein